MNKDDERQRRTDRRSDLDPKVRLALARIALTWEALWPALWPAVGVCGLFVALALFNILPAIAGWAHGLILALFAVALTVALVRGLRRFRFPGDGAVRRRLERDSGLDHRPLGTLNDRLPPEADPVAKALWRAHRERMLQRIRGLRVRLPHPNLAARDPLGLRAALCLVLFVAGIGAWGDWGDRMRAALSPRLGSMATATPAVLDIWLTPPEYTGIAPIFLQPPQTPRAAASVARDTAEDAAQGAVAANAVAAPIAVPVGTTVLARVNGGSGVPQLVANDATLPFEAMEGQGFQVSQVVSAGSEIRVDQGGRTLGSWPITVVPDGAPSVSFVSPPGGTERNSLQIEYRAEDDYGIASVTATIRLSGGIERSGDRTPVELPLSVPGRRPKTAQATTFHDLTPHPWAGLPVTVRVSATDGAGQTGMTEDVALVLPERIFNHPIARAIIEERKKLTMRPDGAREEVARALSLLSSRPQLYYDDIVVFLSLRTAVARLFLDRDEEAVASVQQLLWDTALRIEDGGLSIAERRLRDAEQALMDALDRDASEEELNRLMDELQAALNDFLDELERNLQERLARGEQVPQMPFQPNMQTVDRNDLQQMLDRMREMAETGARDAARQMLSQMQQMLENLRAGQMAQMPQGEAEAWDMMRELQDLARRQQELLDQTFRQSREGAQQQGRDGEMPGEMPGEMEGVSPNRRGQGGSAGTQGRNGQGMQGAADQEALRRALGDLMRRLGESTGDIPRPLGRAEQAMRDAEGALGQGSPDRAVPPQTEALDQLQQGLQAFAEQMMQRMMGQSGQMPGQQRMQADRNRDPLGRPLPGSGVMDNGDVEIPQQSDLQRAREILDELRRRSGDPDRPRIERDYIERLLRQF